MFQGLRPAAPIYILYKAEPRIAVGEVVSVSNPVPQYSATAYQNGMVMPPKAYVDIKIRIADEVVDLQRLPADATIADFGNSGMVVSESKDAIANEIYGFKKASQRALEEVERHKHIVTQCDVMLAELNPQLKKEAEQTAEIENLKRGMADLQDTLVDLKGMLAKALNRSVKKEE